MAYSITRLVGCEHILNIENLTPTAIPNSTGPDGNPTGAGRPGKQRIAFILTNTNLGLPDDDDAQVSITIDSGIAFQSPPNDVSATTDANYNVGTPIDLSTFIPIMHVTPLAPAVVADPDGFIAWEAKPYLIYNQNTAVGTREPVATSQATTLVALPTSGANPNGQLAFTFGTANNVFALTPPEGGLVGSFLVEIDFSHSIAS